MNRDAMVAGGSKAPGTVARDVPAPRDASTRDESNQRSVQATNTVRFDNAGADVEPHKVQAYAELDSEDGNSRALVLVFARRNPTPGFEILVGARLVAMRIEAGSRSAGTRWSVSLEAHTEAARHIGAGHSHYISCPNRGEGRRRAFRTDSAGVLEWLDCPEPDAERSGGRFPYNCSPRMETTAATLGMDRRSPSVTFDLLLTNTKTEDTVRLFGPTIRIPNRIWREFPANLASWSSLNSLNPFSADGFWHALLRATRRRKLIRQRRSAKRDFAAK